MQILQESKINPTFVGKCDICETQFRVTLDDEIRSIVIEEEPDIEGYAVRCPNRKCPCTLVYVRKEPA